MIIFYILKNNKNFFKNFLKFTVSYVSKVDYLKFKSGLN